MVKRGLLALLLAVVGYLVAWPSPLEPKPWTPPGPVAALPAYAENHKLEAPEWWVKQLVGPEAIAFDPQGQLIAGLADGRIVRITPGSDTVVEIANTHGRPLGVAYHPDGRLIICDAHRGLQAMTADGKLETLTDSEGGVPFKFTDDLDIGDDGIIYFSDASARFSIEEFTLDILEHQTSGRLLAYDPATKQTTRLAGDFAFTNGVALGPGGDWVVVAETSTYRLWKVWVKGEHKGSKEIFTDALPGFPDNVRYSKSRHVFWVAIGSPRNPAVDGLASTPWLRTVISRLPKGVQPKPERYAYALAVDETGKPVDSLQHRAPDSYSPVASAIEHDGWLYLGSFAREGVARVKLP
jgi:sugar lactone lactonase YvrE